MTADPLTNAAAVTSTPAASWKPSFNPWLVGVIVSIAAFMEVLDTDIANVALPHIAGSMGASNDESTWVLTSYLVSNAIVLPISGWLSELFGRKRFFLSCIFLFTVSSALCGIAPSLGSLIFFRVLQGLAGGGLQPMAQSILGDSFPPEKRGTAFALYGLTVVIAPAIGPILGGWITDNISWRYIFFINIPVGIAAVALARQFVEDPPYLLKKVGSAIRIDYIGISLLVLGVASLQIVLDKGQQVDWFATPYIVVLSIMAVIGLAGLVVWEWRHDHPVIDVHLFKYFNFAAANFMIFFLGMIMFSSLVMVPQFLQNVMGYTAETAGLVLSKAACFMLVEMMFMGYLTTKIQSRFLIAFGWTALGASMIFSAMNLDLQVSFGSAGWMRVFQAVGLGFLFIPINVVAYIGVPAERSTNVASILNFTRNLGSSVGTSIVTTLLARRQQFHQVYLTTHTSLYDRPFQNMLDTLLAKLGDTGAYASVYQTIQNQAATLAYIDTYWFLAYASAAMLVLCVILKRNDPKSGSRTVAAHG